MQLHTSGRRQFHGKSQGGTPADRAFGLTVKKVRQVTLDRPADVVEGQMTEVAGRKRVLELDAYHVERKDGVGDEHTRNSGTIQFDARNLSSIANVKLTRNINTKRRILIE